MRVPVAKMRLKLNGEWRDMSRSLAYLSFSIYLYTPSHPCIHMRACMPLVANAGACEGTDDCSFFDLAPGVKIPYPVEVELTDIAGTHISYADERKRDRDRVDGSRLTGSQERNTSTRFLPWQPTTSSWTAETAFSSIRSVPAQVRARTQSPVAVPIQSAVVVPIPSQGAAAVPVADRMPLTRGALGRQ